MCKLDLPILALLILHCVRFSSPFIACMNFLCIIYF